MNQVLYTYPFFPSIKANTPTKDCKIEDKNKYAPHDDYAYFEAKLHWDYKPDNSKCPKSSDPTLNGIQPLLVVPTLKIGGEIVISNYVVLENTEDPFTGDQATKTAELKSGFCNALSASLGSVSYTPVN